MHGDGSGVWSVGDLLQSLLQLRICGRDTGRMLVWCLRQLRYRLRSIHSVRVWLDEGQSLFRYRVQLWNWGYRSLICDVPAEYGLCIPFQGPTWTQTRGTPQWPG